MLELALGLGGGLKPVFEKVGMGRLGRDRLVALEVLVALEKIIAKERVLPAGFEYEPFLFAGDVNEEREESWNYLVHRDACDQEGNHADEAGIHRVQGSLAIADGGPQGALQHAAAVHRQADQPDVED